jgi:creatinine amidohydrolase
VAWRHWDTLTTAELRSLDKGRAIALLPVAATEQHGPHLPLATDALIADAIVDAAATHPTEACVLRLPTERIGVSVEHASFPGTLALEPETAIDVWTAIGQSVHRAGVRKLVLFNTHGGQQAIVDIVAQRLRRAYGMLVVRASSFGLGLPDGAADTGEQRYGLHGGRIETSMMLHIAPDLVRRDKVAAFASEAARWEAGFSVLEVEGATGIGWLAEDLNAEGVTGDATGASDALGARLIDHCGRRLAALIADVDGLMPPGETTGGSAGG